MAKMLGFFKKEENPLLKLDSGLLDVNKELAEINRNNQLAQQLYKERELEALRKEKILAEKAKMLDKIEHSLGASEEFVRKRLEEVTKTEMAVRKKEAEIKAAMRTPIILRFP